jgi:hypothetical protein
MPEVPHLSLPLRVIGDRLATIDQDTADELANNVLVITSFSRGERIEDPQFGILALPFDNRPLNLADLETTIATYEPRATISVRQADYDAADPTAARVSVEVSMAGDSIEVPDSPGG